MSLHLFLVLLLLQYDWLISRLCLWHLIVLIFTRYFCCDFSSQLRLVAPFSLCKEMGRIVVVLKGFLLACKMGRNNRLLLLARKLGSSNLRILFLVVWFLLACKVVRILAFPDKRLDCPRPYLVFVCPRVVFFCLWLCFGLKRRKLVFIFVTPDLGNDWVSYFDFLSKIISDLELISEDYWRDQFISSCRISDDDWGAHRCP